MTLTPAGSAGRLLAGSPVLDGPMTFSRWFGDLPVRLAHAAAALWWPWLPLAAVALLAATVAGRRVYRRAWRRAAAGGYWVAVVPPREVDPARWGKVWRLLHTLGRRARGGRWRLARPPLALEIHNERGRLTAGVWLPGWVPYARAAAELVRAWPGATVARAAPPALNSHAGQAVAGYRLRTDSLGPETGWLVDDPAPRPRLGAGGRAAAGADFDLGRVFTALGEAGGPALLQVLARPAPGRRTRRLRAATRGLVTPARAGWHVGAGLVWLLEAIPRLVFAVWDFFTWHGPPTGSAGRQEPDAVAREAMREAAAKLADRPHLLAAVRVGVAADHPEDAAEAAGSVADGFAEASRCLDKTRLRGPAAALGQRRAGRGEWLLVTSSELGVLAHLPPDPALYGFDTAARHRPPPLRAARAAVERPGRGGAGWNRDRWTRPPADTAPSRVDSAGGDDWPY